MEDGFKGVRIGETLDGEVVKILEKSEKALVKTQIAENALTYSFPKVCPPMKT